MSLGRLLGWFSQVVDFTRKVRSRNTGELPGQSMAYSSSNYFCRFQTILYHFAGLSSHVDEVSFTFNGMKQ